MYIKREPLGRGNLTFGKRKKKRFRILFVLFYLAVIGAAVYVMLHLEGVRGRVYEVVGPPPPPTLPAVHYVEQADEAYDAGDLELAAEHYREAVEREPENVDLLTRLARTLILINSEQSLEEAIEVAEQIVLVAPEDPRGYAMKARALNWQGQADQSAIEAMRAIEMDPNYVLGHAYLAEAYADLGQLRQARDQAERAIELDPYDVDARRNYAYVLEFYGDYGGAIAQYQQALQIDPNLLDLWYGLARNYRAAGRTEESVATYNEILIRTPEDPLPYVELGRTFYEVRDDEAAQIHFERAIKLVCEDCPRITFEELEANRFEYPEDLIPANMFIPAWRRLGNVYHTRRNFEDAVAIFEELIAYAKANDEEVPIDTLYTSATDYYYLDRDSEGRPLCNIAIPRAFEALDVYEDERMEDVNALNNILSVIVLCRDFAATPPTVAFTFPEGYEEPDVVVRRGGDDTGSDEDDTEGDSAGDGGE